MSDDIYEDLHQIYAKLQMNSPAKSTENTADCYAPCEIEV
jgi:hypothetical protein